MPKQLTNLTAQEILDSRGNPTVQVTAESFDESATVSVPSGASRGTNEAIEKRDDDPNRFFGMGVLEAIKNIKEVIKPALMGATFQSIKSLDDVLKNLDGTKNKSNLGANAILGVSLAITKLKSKLEKVPLYELFANEIGETYNPENVHKLKLLTNVINGGAHAIGSTSVQEFHIIPMYDNLYENLQAIKKFQTELSSFIIKHTNRPASVGDEGGFTLGGYSTEQALEILANLKAKLKMGSKIRFGLDVAGNELFKDKYFTIDGQNLKENLYFDLIKELTNKYQLLNIEDPFTENCFDAYAQLSKACPDTIIIGDDLTVTNPNLLKEAINKKSISGIIIKPNQIGTVSETLEVIKLAKQNHIHCIASHRSGETNDDFIVDLAVGTGCFGAKFGALQRGERIAKYNRLLQISYDNRHH